MTNSRSMQRVYYPSLINYEPILIGGITTSPQGWYIPKFRTGANSYGNIKGGCGQLTAAQAEAVVIAHYHAIAAKERNWTPEQLQERITRAEEVLKEITEQSQKYLQQQQARATQGKRDRQEALDNLMLSESVYKSDALSILRVTTKTEHYYLLRIEARKGWKDLSDRLVALTNGKPGQKQWQLSTLEEAIALVSAAQGGAPDAPQS